MKGSFVSDLVLVSMYQGESEDAFRKDLSDLTSSKEMFSLRDFLGLFFSSMVDDDDGDEKADDIFVLEPAEGVSVGSDGLGLQGGRGRESTEVQPPPLRSENSPEDPACGSQGSRSL